MSTASAPPAGPAPVEEQEPRGTLGLGPATALIVGSIIGVGIFNLPSSLAGYGPISLVAMALTTIGALALAVMFASLSKRLPADGGPYAYARAGFGNLAGFSNAWLYWITAWSGNAAIVVGWVLYVEEFVNKGGNKYVSMLIALVGLWVPAAINLSGVKNMGAVQTWTSILKFIPLVFMSNVGLFFISSGNFTPWNISGESNVSAIGGAMALCLFSYLGVETAAVAAAKVRNPEKNVPKATIFGTLGTAVVYLLSLTAVFGIVSSGALSESTAPFSTAVNSIFGGNWVRHGRAGGDLRLRGAQRLDDDLRRDAAGRGQGRDVPRGVRQAQQEGRAGLRHHLLDPAGLAVHGPVLRGLGGDHRVQHPGVHERYHRRDPVRLLRRRADQVAAGRPPGVPHAAVRP
jgi:APA family basic amino acid/polyamine antiporter